MDPLDKLDTTGLDWSTLEEPHVTLEGDSEVEPQLVDQSTSGESPVASYPSPEALEWPISEPAPSLDLQAEERVDHAAEAIPGPSLPAWSFPEVAEQVDLLDEPVINYPEEIPSIGEDQPDLSDFPASVEDQVAYPPEVEQIQEVSPEYPHEDFSDSDKLGNPATQQYPRVGNKPEYPEEPFEVSGQTQEDNPFSEYEYREPESPDDLTSILTNLTTAISALKPSQEEKYGSPRNIQPPTPVNTIWAGRVTPPVDLLNRIPNEHPRI